ncbi:hypothetical protein V202x_35880 [Gimesia aquarii]|uniref:Uncharacterized protein n=1 Tax=Gimesia aquarii TaxID=2527964 RepID=A0A517WY65_9PLAN|nr:hypothetical protein V202x_35880 [Gimesia aquarii]
MNMLIIYLQKQGIYLDYRASVLDNNAKACFCMGIF